MGTSPLRRSDLRPATGFSLLEIMISTLFLTVVSVALLQEFELAFRHYGLAHKRWQTSIELWNQSERMRAQPAAQGVPLQIFPGARPLYRIAIGEAGSDGQNRWEVLRAQK